MALRLGLLQTRLGRRVLLLFVGCALIPVGVLGVATYRSVAGQLREQAAMRSREAAKRVGMAILERLELLSTALAWTADHPGTWETADPRLGALILSTPEGQRPLRGQLVPPPLTAAQQVHLDRRRTLLVLGESRGRATLLLAQAVVRGGTVRGILWAEPQAQLLAQMMSVEESSRLGVTICVFQPPEAPIHCPAHVADLAGGALATAMEQASGSFEWSQAATGERYLAGSWSLFLGYSYAAPDWRVVYSESERSVNGPLIRFKKTFPKAALLALLIVALLSNFEIRRNLRPLRALHKATERVARLDFGQPVEIHSGDEFEELAHAFNGMSLRLRTQFEEAEYLTQALRGASDEVREREERLRAVLESAADGIVVVSVGNRVESFNAQAERLFGYSGADVAGRDLAELIGVRIGEAGGLPAGSHGGVTFQVTGRNRDGATFPAEVAVGRAEHGERVFHTVFVRDISERRRAQEERDRLEAQLRQAQKMETIGTLAGGIAHDFNNILTPIIGTVQLVLADAALEPRVRADLEQVGQASQRARDLVKQILTFSRRTEHQAAPVCLGPLVKEALTFLRASLPTTIEIRSRVADDLPPIQGDGTELHQVIMNLCTNAYHAMRGRGGVLDVQVRLTAGEPSLVATHPALAGGRIVRLSIRDTGSGMDQATLERIFEPFFTTKAPGEGTGLGMSIVHGIVTGHGGAITVESAPGVGTLFDIYLPAGQEVTPAAAVVAVAPRRGEGRVLVVDDDNVIAGLVARVLKRAGYDAASVTSPAEALRLLESDPKGFDLVITDHTMPGMTGHELALRIRGKDAGLPLILMSGYAEVGMQSDAGARPLFAEVLLKPVDINTLTTTVSRVLEGAASFRCAVLEEAMV